MLRKMWKQKLALAFVLVMVATIIVTPPTAYADEPIERIYYLFDKIKELNALGVYSDNEVYCVLVDLEQINSTGSVTAYTYKNTITPTETKLTSRKMELSTATSNMTRYILGDIRSTYIEPPFNCSIAMSVYGRTSIPVYVYGDGKSYCIDEIEQALPNIFAINYVPDNSKSGGGNARVPDKPIELPVAESYLKALFEINNTSLTIDDDTIGEPIIIQMDVAPEIVSDRTYIPVRYIAHALGVSDDNIKWDGKNDTVTIANNETIIELTIGSTTEIVNGEPIEMDAAPYVKQIDTGGRTMLPARWVAEPLGAMVTWDQGSGQMIIEVPQPPQEQG